MVRFVVMGAGKSSRMGQDKLALPWKGTTILGHVLDTVILSLENLNADFEIIVVARKQARAYLTEFQALDFKDAKETKEAREAKDPSDKRDYKKTLKYKLKWIQVTNPQPLADTIRLGLSDLSDQVKGICFIPGDQVGIESKGFAKLIQIYQEKTPDFLVPKVGDIAGAPVFFHPRYLTELRALEGENGGKRILYAYRDRWMTALVEESFLLDIDTMEEYTRYQNLN
jgi:molybdenum cofactor cytidylyltransferase